MKDNTARMSATEIVEHFKTTLGDLDLLKVFMVTGVTDISKSYELITKLAKTASGTEKDEYENALKILGKIAVKRILVTETFYNSLNTGELAVAEPEAQTFLMLPKLEDVLNRVRTTLKKGNFSSDSYKEVMDVLNSTVKEGKVVNDKKEPITWSTDEVNVFLNAYETAEKAKSSNKKAEATDKITFSVVFNLASDLAKSGKTCEEIETAIKELVLGKIVGGKDAGSDILMLDEPIFKDFYSRMVSAYVTQAVSKKASEIVVDDIQKAIEEKIEKQVKPLLETMDKNEKEVSVLVPSKLLIGIYKEFKSNITIADAVKKVEELAKSIAPKLFERHANVTKNKVPINKEAAEKAKSPIKEIYDDSHNIQESNKELWAEVENYTLLDQLYKKGVELSKAGKWRDGICMCLRLIADGKIKETADSKEAINWDPDNVKLWYYNNIEMAVSDLNNKEPETIDVEAEVIDNKPAEITETKVIGPVPPAGFTQSKEAVLSKLLKKREDLQSKYAFKFVTVASDHHVNKVVTFEVCDATKEQEPKLIGTELNFIEFIDLQRDELVKSSNAIKPVRKSIMDTLSTCYEMGHSEVKNIVAALNKEAIELRKKGKKEIIANAEKPATSTNIEFEDADDDAEEGATYYDSLAVGATIAEKKDGKRVPIEDGTWILQGDNGEDVEVTTKNGIVTSCIASETSENTGGQASPPVEQANQVQGSVESNKDQVSQSTDNSVQDNTNGGTENIATEPVSNSNNTNNEGNKGEPEKAKSESADTTAKSEPAGTTNTPGDNNKASAEPKNERATEKVEHIKLSYDGFEEILNTHQRTDFQKAIFKKATSYPTLDEGKKAINAIVDQARFDNKWKKTFIRGYKNSPAVEVFAAVTKAIEVGVLAANNPV